MRRSRRRLSHGTETVHGTATTNPANSQVKENIVTLRTREEQCQGCVTRAATRSTTGALSLTNLHDVLFQGRNAPALAARPSQTPRRANVSSIQHMTNSHKFDVCINALVMACCLSASKGIPLNIPCPPLSSHVQAHPMSVGSKCPCQISMRQVAAKLPSPKRP